MRFFLLVLALSVEVALAGDLRLLAIGVEHYSDPQITPLQYAADDALALANAYLSAGVRRDNVTVLTATAGDQSEAPTKAAIIDGLLRLRSGAEPDDTVIVFYAGHGVLQDGTAWLLPYDARLALLADTGLRVDAVHELLRGCQARQIMLFVDACRNAPEAARGQLDSPLSDGLARSLRPLYTGPTGEPRPAGVLMSCSIGERAWEMPEQRHGAFTFYLLQGLAKETRDEGGKVSVRALAAYVEAQVAAWARTQNRSQTPVLEIPDGLDIVLDPAGDPKPAAWPDYLKDLQPPEAVGWGAYQVWPVDGMPAVRIAGGDYPIGSALGGRDERPVQVTLSPFWMDVHEVTNEQYCQFLNARPRYAEELARWLVIGGRAGAAIQREGDVFRPAPGSEHLPVVFVRYDGAQAYANWAGRALPTEVQWEVAARAGQQWLYYWGDEPRIPTRCGNFGGNADGFAGLAQVGSFAPNAFGLLDMEGNVAEQCRDWYDPDSYGAIAAPDPWQSERYQHRHGPLGVYLEQNFDRVVRGGYWYANKLDQLRPAWRNHRDRNTADRGLGFRCAWMERP